MNSLRIAITPGEPAGIGPDLVIELAQHPLEHEIIVIADPDLLGARAEQIKKPFNLKTLPVKLKTPVKAGQLNPENAGYVTECLKIAAQACLDKTFSALVTGPVQKSIIPLFTGQTEFLAKLCTVENAVMMLATKELRVALVTTHLPLRAVPDAITPETLKATLEILNNDLKMKFGILKPHILVCGLNPHAGEAGTLGVEEINIIEPVIRQCQLEGMQVFGPYSADTIFLKKADAFLAMYHDQGLPVLKQQGFGEAVNITLGLPIIRTSVDHGTALELAGKGLASITSLQHAIQYAAKLCQTSTKP